MQLLSLNNSMPLVVLAGCSGMHLSSSYFGVIISEQCRFSTSWGQQSSERWLDCVVTFNPVQGEEPD